MTESQQPPCALLTAVDWPVKTARLQLRPAEPHDGEATWTFGQLPEFSQRMARAPAISAQCAVQFVQPESLRKSLVIELDGTVSATSWSPSRTPGRRQKLRSERTGCRPISAAARTAGHSGRGYATEAVREVLRICFADLGLRRVTADCFAANVTYWRLMERVGMRREAYTVRDSLHKSGGWLDGMSYALLQEEWPASN